MCSKKTATIMMTSMCLLVVMLATTLSGCSDEVSPPPPEIGEPQKPQAQLQQPQAQQPQAQQPPPTALPSFASLVEQQGKAVVNISTTQKIAEAGAIPFSPSVPPDHPFYEFFRRFAPPELAPREFQRNSLGSGFIVSADGYVLTNSHVVENAHEVMVRLNDARELQGSVVGTDPRTDLALLKVEATDLPTVTIGNPDQLAVGDWVVAIGSPFGFESTVTQGIVSAKGRALPQDVFVPFIQTDVAINPGNSGGPLFNLKGEVVGINSVIYSVSGGYMGVAFAIPIDIAMKVKDQLVEHGRVRRGQLGVVAQEINQALANSFGLEQTAGALVSAVTPEGPAAGAGIQPGDVILQVNDRDIANPADLARAIGQMPPDTSAELKLWRQGEVRSVRVKVQEMESREAAMGLQPEAQEPEAGPLGLLLRELDESMRAHMQAQGSLLVEGVRGKAAEAGIMPGDVILGVNNFRVQSAAELGDAVRSAERDLALLVQRGKSTVYVPIRIKD